jgi:hypothetical protein
MQQRILQHALPLLRRPVFCCRGRFCGGFAAAVEGCFAAAVDHWSGLHARLAAVLQKGVELEQQQLLLAEAAAAAAGDAHWLSDVCGSTVYLCCHDYELQAVHARLSGTWHVWCVNVDVQACAPCHCVHTLSIQLLHGSWFVSVRVIAAAVSHSRQQQQH